MRGRDPKGLILNSSFHGVDLRTIFVLLISGITQPGEDKTVCLQSLQPHRSCAADRTVPPEESDAVTEVELDVN